MASPETVGSVLDRCVGCPASEAVRIVFETGEVFVLRYLSEVPDATGMWSGEIVAAENLRPESAKFFVPGSGIDFSGAEILEIVDERTGRLLFSRRP